MPSAVILVFAAGFSSLNEILESAMQGLGDTRGVLKAELIGLAGTGVLLLGLMPRFGIVGASVASLVAYAVLSWTLLVLLVRTGRVTA